MSERFNLRAVGAKRLMKEFKEMQIRQFSETDPPYSVELVDENINDWNVRLYNIDQDSKLANDLLENEIPHILLNIKFPENFPFAPPFMRVIEPVIEGGYVLGGGSICMELLTPQGWNPTYTVESVLMSFSASVVKGDGRLDKDQSRIKQYTMENAKMNFDTIVRSHEVCGWSSPPKSDG